MRFADEAKEEGDHYEAVKYLRKAIEMQPERTDVRYELAQALRRSKLYEDALGHYEKVYQEDRRGDEFPECLLWLAKMQEHQGEYQEAKRSWGNLKRQYMRDKEHYLHQRAEQGARSCDWAQDEMEKEPQEVEREEFPINTTGSEFAPLIHQDSLFLFSVLRPEEENQDGSIEGKPPRARILKAPSISRPSEDEGGGEGGKERPTETAWGEPEPLEGPWNEKLHMANSSFNEKGDTLFFSLCEEEKGEKLCDIHFSTLEEGSWSEPEPLPHPINRDSSNDTHPMTSTLKGKKVLFFSSDRPEGSGGMDIWWVTRKNGGEYGKVRNAGDSINSPENEVTPFFLKESRELYFSSEWHVGFGGYDLFKSKWKGKKERFGEPMNLGKNINSSYDDLYPFVDVERNKGFFASNRKDSRQGWVGMCCHDLYNWPVTIEPETDTIEIVTLEDLNRFLPVTLYFHNDRPDPRTLDTTTSIRYDESYRDYKERVPTYIEEYSEGLSGVELDSSRVRMKRFFDERVDEGMQNLRLFSELLLEELKKGQDIELTIKGYASPLADTDYNVNLTKRRIASLINFLRSYEDGAYIPYMEGDTEEGSLSFLFKPYGEYSADSVVSDELEDQRESVYSVSAALERKIEIEQVKQVREDSAYADLSFEKGVHDFGKVEADSSYKHRFRIRNEGEDTLRVDSVKSHFEGLTMDLEKGRLSPGEKGWLNLKLEPGEEKGKQVRRIRVYSNSIPKKREASVTYELRD